MHGSSDGVVSNGRPGEPPTLVACKDCEFRRVVDGDDAVRAGDVLLFHGRHTGHELRVDGLER